MKKNNLFKLTHIAWVMLMSFALISTSCTKDDDDDDTPGGGTTPVEDGTYLTGEATGFSEINIDMAMWVGREEGEEFASVEREGMWELFAYLTADKDFSMVTVAGATQTTYGIKDGTAATKVLAGENSQINATIDTGMVVTDGTAWQVKADGLYHIVVDINSETYYIMPINTFGIIGDATLNGWSGEVEMTEESLTAEAGKWTLTDIELRQGSFKFRYDNGWKVNASGYVLFSNIGTDGGTSWMMGGNGWSIPLEDQGLYDVTFEWSLSDGFSYTTVKKGDIAVTDWTGVVLDAVGDGVSADNANAIEDPSAWGWGYKLIADNDGVPAINENMYTWTWNGITLVENAGFKLRTENGEAPANGNGASFDVGFGAVNAGLSSENVVEDGGNITVTVAGNYNITLTIDAATGDVKEVIIVEEGNIAKLWVPGAYQGWAPDVAPTISDEDGDGIFVGIVEITGEDLNFKFTSQANWDGPNYGAGEADGSLSTDPTAGNLNVPAAGSYEFTVNTNEDVLTWSYIAQ